MMDEKQYHDLMEIIVMGVGENIPYLTVKTKTGPKSAFKGFIQFLSWKNLKTGKVEGCWCVVADGETRTFMKKGEVTKKDVFDHWTEMHSSGFLIGEDKILDYSDCNSWDEVKEKRYDD